MRTFENPLISQTVEMVDTASITGMQTNRGQSKSVVVHLNNGEKKLVQTCSPSYGLIPMYTILDQIEAALDPVFGYTSKYQVIDDSKFYIDYVIQGMGIKVGDRNDVINPKIRIMHSYDSSLVYGVHAGFWRLICKNGLEIELDNTLVTNRRSKKKHTSGMATFCIEDTMEIVNTFVNEAKKYSSKYQKLANVTSIKNIEGLGYRESRMLRLEEIADSTGFNKRLLPAVEDRLLYECQKLEQDPTDWLIYNAFNYQLSHNREEIKMQDVNRMAMDVAILEYMTV